MNIISTVCSEEKIKYIIICILNIIVTRKKERVLFSVHWNIFFSYSIKRFCPFQTTLDNWQSFEIKTVFSHRISYFHRKKNRLPTRNSIFIYLFFFLIKLWHIATFRVHAPWYSLQSFAEFYAGDFDERLDDEKFNLLGFSGSLHFFFSLPVQTFYLQKSIGEFKFIPSNLFPFLDKSSRDLRRPWLIWVPTRLTLSRWKIGHGKMRMAPQKNSTSQRWCLTFDSAFTEECNFG